MKIGICGPQSSGKSTLARALAGRLGLPLIEEQARVVAQGMGVMSEEMLRRANPELQVEFQRRCLQQQQRAEAQHPGGFVSDRTVVDNAAYWLAWNHAHSNLYYRYGYLVDCQRHAASYDLIVYCPPLGTEPEDDGFRIPSRLYQQEIDLLIRTLLVGWELPFITAEGSVEERVQQVLSEVTKGASA